jgi:hypothetical protein
MRRAAPNECHGLCSGVEEGPYAADLRGQLLRVPGAMRQTGTVRFLGVVTRAVRVPLTIVFDGDAPVAVEEIGDEIAF